MDRRYTAEYRPLTLEKRVINGKRFIVFKELEDEGVVNLMTTKDMDMGFTTISGRNRINEQYDEIKDILKNDLPEIYVMRQIHSANVFDIKDFDENADQNDEKEMYLKGDIRVIRNNDGLITDKEGKAICVTVADCVPLVIFDRKNRVLANLHSGWKGTYLEIGKEGLRKLQETYGTEPQNCSVFIGPHISKDDFEVTSELKDQFTDKFTDIYIERKDDTHYTIDLTSIIADMFSKLGVERDSIFATEASTYSENDLYHSFRRDRDQFGIMSLITVLK